MAQETTVKWVEEARDSVSLHPTSQIDPTKDLMIEKMKAVKPNKKKNEPRVRIEISICSADLLDSPKNDVVAFGE